MFLALSVLLGQRKFNSTHESCGNVVQETKNCRYDKPDNRVQNWHTDHDTDAAQSEAGHLTAGPGSEKADAEYAEQSKDDADDEVNGCQYE